MREITGEYEIQYTHRPIKMTNQSWRDYILMVAKGPGAHLKVESTKVCGLVILLPIDT